MRSPREIAELTCNCALRWNGDRNEHVSLSVFAGAAFEETHRAGSTVRVGLRVQGAPNGRCGAVVLVL